MIERITYNEQEIAIIIRKEFKKPGVHFFTPNDYSQQLAYMAHPSGKKILPHIHKKNKREVLYTQETLIIKEGKLRVSFYSEDQKFLFNKILNAGDIILLIKGGHGFEVLEDIEMIEIKQGPYAGDNDKIKFNT